MVIRTIKKLAKHYSKLVSTSDHKIDKITPPPKNNQESVATTINFSLLNIAKVVIITIALVGLGLLLFNIRDILLIFFASMLFATALAPTIAQLEKHKIPRSISAIVILIAVITITSLIVGNMIPILAQQLFEVAKNTQNLIGNIANGNIQLPIYLDWLNPILKDIFAGTDTDQFSTVVQNYLLSFGEELKALAGNAFLLLKSLSNGLANALIVFFFTYFMIVDEKIIDNFILKLFPKQYSKYITQTNTTIKNKVGLWLRGQIVLMVLIGILSYIGLRIINLEYAFTLAVFAGISELIPVIGPIIAWIAVIPIAANSAQPLTAILWVTIIYFAIQRVESDILVPAIMKQATGLHPIVVLLGMLIGFKLIGILGAVIAVPVAAILSIFFQDLLDSRKSK